MGDATTNDVKLETVAVSTVPTDTQKPKANSFDDILKDIGEFGPYQKWIFALLCLPSFVLAGLMIIQVFTLGLPDHRCKIPWLENDTYAVQSDFHQSQISDWIPADSAGKYDYDRCHILTYEPGTNSSRPEKCQEWVYSEDVFENTFAKQLNMVCDDAIKIPNAQMAFFFGVLTGSFFYGQLSDIIGRRKTLYLCLVVQLVSSVGVSAMVEYIGFCVLMFIVGGSILGVYMTAYVIGMELVGPNKRIWTGNVAALLLTTGQLYLILVVYLVPDWKYFMLADSLPACLFLPYLCYWFLNFLLFIYDSLAELQARKQQKWAWSRLRNYTFYTLNRAHVWLIPESCRWLLSNGRKKEAAVILKKVARSNKTHFDPAVLETLPPPQMNGRVWQLFSSNATLRCWTCVIFFNWFVCSFSYYGVVLNTSNLGGDFLFNMVLFALAEYPGKIIDVTLMDRIGRKRLYVGYMFIGGLANVATIYPIVKDDDSLHPVLIGLAMVGKLCITGAFGTIYVHSAEIYPTVVRNAGMGSSSAVARVGSMLAPYIAKSADLIDGDIGKCIPLTLFGIAMFLAGLFTMCILPETYGKELPESIEDVEKLKHDKSPDLTMREADVAHINTAYTDLGK